MSLVKLAVKLILGVLLVAMGVLLAKSPLWQQPGSGIKSISWPALVFVLVVAVIGGLLYIAEQTYYKTESPLTREVPLRAKKWSHIGLVAAAGAALGYVVVFHGFSWPNEAGWYFLAMAVGFLVIVTLDIRLVDSKDS